METTKIVIGTAILLLVASTPFFAWRLGRKHGWSRLAGGGAALVGLMAYCNHLASMQPIGPGWAVSVEPTLGIEAGGGNLRLYRVTRFRRKKLEDLIAHRQHYRPDCVAYVSSRLAIKGTLFVVCGDRTPVAVDAFFDSLAPDGLRNEETIRLDDYRERVHYRIVPADSLRALAQRQPRYSRQRHREAERERGIPLRMIEESTVVRAVQRSSR